MLSAFPEKWENTNIKLLSLFQTTWECNWGLRKASWQTVQLSGQTSQHVAQTGYATSVLLLQIPNSDGDRPGHPALADPAWAVLLDGDISSGDLQPRPSCDSCDNFLRTHTQASETAALCQWKFFTTSYKTRGWQYYFLSKENIVNGVIGFSLSETF